MSGSGDVQQNRRVRKKDENQQIKINNHPSNESCNLFLQKELVGCSKNSIFIIKQNKKKYWHKKNAISDISEIMFVNPKKARGITGQTAAYPIERGGIRAYELGLIRRK